MSYAPEYFGGFRSVCAAVDGRTILYNAETMQLFLETSGDYSLSQIRLAVRRYGRAVNVKVYEEADFVSKTPDGVTFTLVDEITGALGLYEWSIRLIDGTNAVLETGQFEVLSAAIKAS